MAREYLVVKGNYYYLVDLDANTGYSFSEYGQSMESVNARYALSLEGCVKEVDILSILSDSTMSECELYLNGDRVIVKGTGMGVFSKISKSLPRVSFTTFRIVRPEMVGLVQILVPLNKNVCDMKTVKGLLGV